MTRLAKRFGRRHVACLGKVVTFVATKEVAHAIATFSEVFCLAMGITFNRLSNELAEGFEFRLFLY